MELRTREGQASATRVVALVIGCVYLVLGVVGFFVGTTVLWFSTGPLLDVVRTAIGLAALVAARRAVGAQFLGMALMVLLTGLVVYGVLVALLGSPLELSGLFGLRWPDTVLHAVTVVAGALIGIPNGRGRSRAARPPGRARGTARRD
ncbi:DUF4383 domain-containing protein [Amycolatopsis nigrescens]|uniref:DUF4383 domain-containing protein n=1 Tax=Amycolatopsis nigrescens TaxID=381445 RepID=UPI00035C2A13|nr:DUF4383 domain-containing protein [Amycolatopsis nigrescens]